MRARQPAFTRSSVALAAAALVGTLASTPASAAVCTWNAANGNWDALANWLNCVAGNGNPGGVPGGADTAVIGGAGVVTVNTSQAVNTLNNAGQINIDAFLLTLGAGGTTNTGVINVGGASTAALQVFGNVNNAGGVINVGNGSVINQFGTSFTGGTINTSGTGKVAVQGFSGGNLLNGVTLAGNMDMAGAGQVSQRVTGGLALGGTVSVGSGSYLNFQGTQTLSGTGSIVFADNNGNNRLNVDGAGSVLTIG
ncbi:MAG TPA: hypothetical protein PLA97_24195, partial [Rubrivivax sp.]|nr:hypothetical protein [Rubrivivax sp.]